MALNIYHEARGESTVGQYAVAHVTMNRAQTPDNVCKVVLEKNQFSWTNQHVAWKHKRPVLKKSGVPTDSMAWTVAQLVAESTLSRTAGDFTGGAKFYHEKSIRPSWANAKMVRLHRYGNHIFYRQENKSPMTGRA